MSISFNRLNFKIVKILEKQLMTSSGKCLERRSLEEFRRYGRSVTTSSLKEDEEINKIRQKHANEISSLKDEMNEMRDEMRYCFSQLLQNNLRLNVQDIPGVVGSNLVSPVDVSSLRGQNIPNSSVSTHDPNLVKVFFWLLRLFSLSLSLSLSLLFIEV